MKNIEDKIKEILNLGREQITEEFKPSYEVPELYYMRIKQSKDM